eukprot:TRINITY_DN1892_c0_g2_i1.p1 TRINITY_DN1892_c0_g2~~TRINITY_DN1892_c0_g2_i1.p1  ORF type:complete len:681 (+),score=218.78 TRINITY_DN1892_c0_g2_i1:73-2115(+)
MQGVTAVARYVQQAAWGTTQERPEAPRYSGEDAEILSMVQGVPEPRMLDGEQTKKQLGYCTCLLSSVLGNDGREPPSGLLVVTTCRLLLMGTSSDSPLLEIHLGELLEVVADASPMSPWLAKRREEALACSDVEFKDRVMEYTDALPTLQLRLRSGGVAALALWEAKDRFADAISDVFRPTVAIAAFATPAPARESTLLSEYRRMGVTEAGAHGWRLNTALNATFGLCATYPRVLAFPTAATPDMIRGSAAFRSSQRLPVLSWRCASTGQSISRCSQPLSGPLGNFMNHFQWRSTEDENLVSCIRRAAPGHTFQQEPTLYIYDCRPHANAVANQLKGGGHEREREYENARVVFGGIGNIHVMSKSLQDLQNLYLSDGSAPYVSPAASGSPRAPREEALFCEGRGKADSFLSSLDSTQWIEALRLIVRAGLDLATIIRDKRCSVLVHCSDGWDRTAQVCAMAQLILDPHYRTLKGFRALVEKEWVEMGHRFHSRAAGVSVVHTARLRPAAQSSPPPVAQVCGAATSECSPIFLQWLAAVANLVAQLPAAFEFTDELLRQLAVHHASGVYRNFLGDNEQQRATLGGPCFWQQHGHYSSAAYDSAVYPGALASDNFDLSTKCMFQWVVHDAASRMAVQRADGLARAAAAEHCPGTHDSAYVEKLQAEIKQLKAQLASRKPETE